MDSQIVSALIGIGGVLVGVVLAAVRHGIVETDLPGT